MKSPLVPRLLAGCACIVACLGAVPAFAADTPAPAEHQPGIWQEHRYSFAFMGFTSTYSCDGLADKLKILLLAAGARNDAKARPGACASSLGRPDKFARADLTFYTLSPTGGGAAAGGTPVDGIWRQVAFASRNPRELTVGDCELVEQFKSTVLPFFTTQNIETRTTCIPHQESGSVIDLKFQSLSAAPTTDEHGRRTQAHASG